MNIFPPPPMLAMGPFGGPSTQFVNTNNYRSGVQIGNVILNDKDCFQMPNDENIYKAIFHWSTALAQKYRFEGITRLTYNQGDWGNNERIHQNGFAQRMAGLRLVPCPTFNRELAREVYPILRTLNAVSHQGTVPAMQGLPTEMQPMIESYLTGVGERRPAGETRMRMRELITRPRPGYWGSPLEPGVGGKKRARKTRHRRAANKKRKQTRRRH